MKKLILLLSLFCNGIALFSQTPQSVPYQAVARNATGNLMQNQGISLRFTIHDATTGGTVLYQETQAATTNNLGLFNVNVGLGAAVTGTFSNIAWGNGNAKYIQVEIDPNGGTNYTNLGASQMMSVPYALYAANAGAVAGTEPAIAPGANTQYWRGDKTWQTLNTTAVPEGTNLYYTNARGIGSTLTGYSSTTGAITSADNILTAIEKLNGNVGAIVSGVSSVNGNAGVVALTGSASISISAANMFSINSTYPGQSSITTVGTIGAGTWNGAAIGATYGGTGLNTSGLTGFPYVTSGTWSVINAATALTNLGALSTTSFNTAISGTTGDVTYFNGTNSVTGSPNFTWANATNQLSVGLSSTTANPGLVVVGANAGGPAFKSTNSSTTTSSSAISGVESGATGLTYGVSGSNVSTTAGAAGVYGSQTGAGTTYGVYGANSGNGGTGVYGLNTSTGTGTQFGVYGAKTGATGTGTGYGVYGTATGTATTNTAAYFSASGGTANYSIIVPNGGGNVGIGTSTPGASLEISRGTDATQVTGTGADLVVQTRTGAAAAARMAFVSNDNVGGNVSAGAIDGWSNAYGGGCSKAVEINFPTSQGGSSGAVNGNISFSVNNGTASTLTEGMRITSNGNVGIGTGAPAGELEVRGIAYMGSANPNTQIKFDSAWSSYPDNSIYGSEICNDISSYKALMIVGNKCGTAGVRTVGIWDRLGIQTSTPSCPLDVEGSNSISSSGYSYGLSGGNGPNEGYNSAEAVSIRTNQNILCGGALLALSDARIKNITGHSDASADLTTLNKIKITDYTMRDELSYGHKQFKKVIAQQLKEVYPIAVRTSPMPQVIPNIYHSAEYYAINGKEIAITMPVTMSDTNIKVGVTCKFYMNDKNGKDVEEKGTIASFSATQLHIITEKPLNRNDYNDNLFVYGTEIHDLLSVDYDAISMLNVSATQEIAKRLKAVEAENELLKNSNTSLQEENSKLKTSINNKADVMDVNKLKAQLDELKTLMESNGIRTEK